MRGLRERFERFVPDRSPGRCWEWLGSKDAHGYGRINLGRQGEGVGRAHRVAWELYVGTIPEGALLVRWCRSATCSNPAHHFLGTMADAMRAAGKRDGFPNRATGERSGKAKVTDAQVRAMRRLYESGRVTQRQLADELGLGESTVQGIVSGRRRAAA